MIFDCLPIIPGVVGVLLSEISIVEKNFSADLPFNRRA
jgi:hypothetical protein